MAHANARLGPAGRRELVRLMVDERLSERQAAACLSVSPCTAHRWKRRWLGASEERAALGCVGRWIARAGRTARPRARLRSVEQQVLAERERTGWGPRLIAGRIGRRALDGTRDPQAPRPLTRCRGRRARRSVRYQWPCPGDLLHMDIKRYRRFRRPGHPFISDERQTSKEINTQLGYDYCHAILDYHSRLAYAELLADTRAEPSPPSPTAPWPGSRATASASEGDDRRRLDLHPQPRPARAACRARHPPHRHPALHAALDGKSNACTRPWTAMGARPALPQQQRPKPRPETLAAPLQPPPTPQRSQRPTTHHPRSQPLSLYPPRGVRVRRGRRWCW